MLEGFSLYMDHAYLGSEVKVLLAAALMCCTALLFGLPTCGRAVMRSTTKEGHSLAGHSNCTEGSRVKLGMHLSPSYLHASA